MAEVRNFRDYSKKTNSETSEQTEHKEPSYKEKIRNHKLLIFYRGVIMAAVGVAIIFILYIHWRDKVYSESRVLETVDMKGMDGASVMSLGESLLKYSKDGVSCIAADGSPKWDITYEMQTPVVRSCEETVAIGDYKGNEIYVANDSGSLGQINTNLPILDFCVSAQGVVAATLEDGDVTRINLYDTEGTELATIKATMSNSGYPVSVSISPNGELLGVSYLGEDSGKIVTRVAFFNFGDVGQNSTDNMVSSFNYEGSVIPFDHFINSDTNVAVGDDRVLFFKGTEVPNNPITSLIQDKEVLGIYCSDEYVGLVCTGTSEDGDYEMLVYNTKGKEVLDMPFDLAYTNAFFSDDQFVVYNDSEWALYGLDGKKRFQGEFDDTVLAIIPGVSRSRFTIVTSDALKQIELR